MVHGALLRPHRCKPVGRYANVPKVQSEIGGGSKSSGRRTAGGTSSSSSNGGGGAAVGQFCHRFDLQKTFGDSGAGLTEAINDVIDLRDACDDPVCDDATAEDGTKMLPPYDLLYTRIAAAVQSFGTGVAVNPGTRRNVLRVSLYPMSCRLLPFFFLSFFNVDSVH